MQAVERWSLAVELTTWCNQRCRHCYNAWAPGTSRTLDRSLLLELMHRALGELELDHVTLTGGEPLGHGAVWQLMELCRDRAVPFQLVSNGSLFDEPLVRRLAALGPRSVQLTLNGPDAERHDAAVGRSGHWERTVAAIDCTRDHQIPVVGCIVITHLNASSVGEILDHFRARGIGTVALSRFSPAGIAARRALDLLPTRSDLLVALEQAEERAREHGIVLQTATPIPPCVVDYQAFPHVKFASCSIGSPVQEFALGTDGQLRNCPLYATALGDATRTSFASLARLARPRPQEQWPAFCQPCPAALTCRGGCGAAAVALTGDPSALDPLVAQHTEQEFAARVRQARSRARHGAGTP